MTITEPLITPAAGGYVTIHVAADALAMKPWPVPQLGKAGELRAVRYGLLTLVSQDDVGQIGGEF